MARISILVCTLGGLLATSAHALPIVSLDADPATPGIQASVVVPNGASFSVDIVISGVDAGSPLNAFELDVDFDSLVLAGTSAGSGGFLTSAFVVQQVLGTGVVEFAEATLGSSGSSGSGVLATLTFDALAPGTSVLDLNDVLLSAPFGVPISAAGIFGATVSVLPEPSTIALTYGGLLMLVALRLQA